MLLIAMFCSTILYPAALNDFALLIRAINENSIEAAREIFIKNPDTIRAESSHPIKPLIFAVYDGNFDMAKLLVENGADVNASMDMITALHIASALQTSVAKDIINFLLENGADIDAAGPKGETPLMSAAASGQFNTAQLLIEKGANVHAVSSEGETPLMSAVIGGNINVVKLLVEKGADIYISKDNGDTAISLAAKTQKPDILAYLLELNP